MKRFEGDIERQARKLSAAAYSMLSAGATVEEARAAFEAGIAEAQASQARTAAAREQLARYTAGDRTAPTPRPADTERPAEPLLTVPQFPPAVTGRGRHSAA